MGTVVRAKTITPSKKMSPYQKQNKKKSNHTARYYALMRAVALRNAAKRMAAKRAAALKNHWKHHGRKFLTIQELPAST